MSTPKTNCSECGTEILQITAGITGGLCMPCSNRKKREMEPRPDWLAMMNGEPVRQAPQLEADAVIQAGFFPGFTSDLTSWETQVTSGGTVIQEINWLRFDTLKDREREICKGEASQEAVVRLESLVQSLDIPGIESIAREVCIDDAEQISFLIPSRKFRCSISLYTLEFHERKDRCLSDAALAGLASARALWDHIESMSPYTTSQHWKKDR